MSVVQCEARTASQSGNVTDLRLYLPDGYQKCTNWHLQIVCTGTPSAGTVTMKSSLPDADRFFAVNDTNGNAVSLDITTSDLVTIKDYVMGAAKITMAEFATATEWIAILRGW